MRIKTKSLFYITLVFLIGLPALLFAQEQELDYGASTSAYVATGDAGLPFWLYANTDGRVDGQSSNSITQLYSHYRIDSEDSPFRFESGLNITSRFSTDNSLFFNELYAGAGWRFLNLKMGRFYDTIGLNDHDLSMGSMMVSRNATPVPKLQLETDGFTDIPYTNSHLQFKAMLSHGWLEEDRYVSEAYLHQKYLYLKVQYNRFEVMGGMVHNVVWGGTSPKYGKLPSSFGDFIDVLTGSSASADPNVPNSDISNAIGNSVAAYNAGLRINFDKFRFSASRLFYLEDRVSTRLRSPWDGTWSANVDLKGDNRWINAFTWEHMNTKRQDARDYDPRGRATYYNNSVYKSGWSYEGNVLGNPLITYGSNPNFSGTRAISNNIIIAHHLGIKGKPTKRFNYKALFTYSRNYGTKRDQGGSQPYKPLSELRIDEYSTLLKGNYLLIPRYGLELTGSMAYDIGDLYGKNRFGFQLGISISGASK